MRERTAQQISKRGGEVYCVYVDKRVKMSGQAIKYRVGSIEI